MAGYEKRYRLTSITVNTEKDAKMLVKVKNRMASGYIRENKPARYTPWEIKDADGNIIEQKWKVWYWTM